MSMSDKAQEILAQSTRRWPSRAAIIDRCGSYSYQQIHRAAEGVTRALQQAEVTPGSVVGISVAKASSFLASLFGVLGAECIAIPVAPHASHAERARIVSETGVTWIVMDQPALRPDAELSGVFCDRALQIILWRDCELTVARCGTVSKHALLQGFPDAAVIRHTSGTTGKSKGVVLSHKAVQERTDASIQLLGLTNSDVVLAPLSISYHFIASALSCVKVGATILDSVGISGSEMLELGSTYGATVMYAAPIQYEEISRANLSRPLSRLRSAISTSALLPKYIAESFFERFSVRLTQVYGIIEVGLPLWNELESIEPSALGICKLPYEARVVDQDGMPVRAGEVGELAIRGPGFFSGYLLGAPRADERCLLEGEWFLTGDLVVQDELGVILYRGRKKSVINCGGNKVFPEEVEEVLRRCPEIREVRVSAKPDPRLGSLIVAEVVVDSQKRPAIEAWSAVCRSELSSYKVPNEFVLVESLPTTGSGKIVR